MPVVIIRQEQLAPKHLQLINCIIDLPNKGVKHYYGYLFLHNYSIPMPPSLQFILFCHDAIYINKYCPVYHRVF
jgi:hypothetical protein